MSLNDISRSKSQKEEQEIRLRERNNLFFIIVVSLFLILLFWKIATASFKIDFAVLITFLLALFSIGMSYFYYLKVNTVLKEVREYLSGEQAVTVHSENRNSNIKKPLDEASKDNIIQFDQFFSSDEIDPTVQLEVEEKTLKLKEEERKELLERLLSQAGLDEDEKQVYISQFEKVDDDLFNVRSNLQVLRKRINQSFSDMFVLEKTKQVRDIIDQLGSDFVNDGSFAEINARFQSLKTDLSQASIDFLEENAYIDNEGSLNRKGYREFLRVAKKMS